MRLCLVLAVPLTPRDEASVGRIEKEFRAKFLMFRLTNHAAVKNFSFPEHAFPGPSRRIGQIARALSAPLLGDQKSTAELFAILRPMDRRGAPSGSWSLNGWLFSPCSTCATRIWFVMVLAQPAKKFMSAYWPSVLMKSCGVRVRTSAYPLGKSAVS